MSTTRRFGIVSALLLSLAPLHAGAAPRVEPVQYYRNDDPRSADPRYNDPRYNDPRYNDPRYSDPRYNDPRYNDRRNDDRGYNDRPGDDRRGGDAGFNGRGGAGVPGGSYLASCGDGRMQGSTLVATCRGRHGDRYQTTLDTSRCGRSDIGNDNGTLQCSGARGSSRRLD